MPPEKIGKPKEKTEKEKAEDKKLLEEIESDPSDPNVKTRSAEEIFDPLAQQADRLPASIKGSDGDKSHVLPVDDMDTSEGSITSEDDEELGGGIGDGSDLTAD